MFSFWETISECSRFSLCEVTSTCEDMAEIACMKVAEVYCLEERRKSEFQYLQISAHVHGRCIDHSLDHQLMSALTALEIRHKVSLGYTLKVNFFERNTF